MRTRIDFEGATRPPSVILNATAAILSGSKYLVAVIPAAQSRARFFDCGLRMALDVTASKWRRK